jgi:hypothetical protein
MSDLQSVKNCLKIVHFLPICVYDSSPWSFIKILSGVWFWLQTGSGFIGFTGLFDTARDYNLQFALHSSVHGHIFTAVAW